MNSKRLLLAGFATLLVAAVAVAAWRMPLLADGDRYRNAIAALASARLGCTVTIAGPVGLAIWPTPELTAEQVDIGGDGHGGSGFHVAALRLRVRLAALLAGRVEAHTLVLHGADWRLPWPLPQSVLASRPPRWLGPFAARIEGATLRLGDMTVTDIDATVTQGEDGMLSAAGAAHLNDRAGRFTLRLGTPGGDGNAGLDATLDGTDQLSGSGARFAGIVASDGSLAGHITARGTDLGLLFGAPLLAFRAEGRLTVGDGLVAMDEATFDLAGTPVTGALALRMTPRTRLDVALSATRLDLDPWLAALLPGSGHGIMDVALPVGVDLAVEAARLGGGILEHLRARADITDGTAALHAVTAILPGEASLQMEGAIDATRSFVGTMRLDAPALRTTLRWLDGLSGANLPLPPGQILRTAAFAASLRLGPGGFALDGLTGRMDGAAIAGSFHLDRGAHPGFAVDVATDRLALDAWLPPDALPSPKWSWPANGPANGPASGLFARIAGGQTARVSVRAERATLLGLPIDEMVLDATMTPEGQLTLRQFDGIASGMRMNVAGTVGPDGRVSDARLSLIGGTAKPLAALFTPSTIQPAFWESPIALKVQGGGPASALSLGVALAVGDARLEAQPVVDLATGDWRATAMLHHPGATRLLSLLGLPLDTGDAARMTGAPGWLGEGSLSLQGQFSGTRGKAGQGMGRSHGWDNLAADHFELTAGLLRARGKLTLNDRKITGSVAADVMPIPLPEPSSETPFQIAALHGWQAAVGVHATQVVTGARILLEHAALNVTLDGDKLTLDSISGQVGGGTLSGAVSLAMDEAPPLLTATAKLDDALISRTDNPAFGPLSGHVDGSITLTANGYSQAAMLATLAGSLQASIRDGIFAGFDLPGATSAVGFAEARTPGETEQALRASVQAGTTQFDHLTVSAEAAHGLLRLTHARMEAPAGSVEAQGSVGLTDGMLDLHVSLQPAAPGAPTIGLRLDGPIGEPGHGPEMAAVAHWLAERPPTR